MAKGYNGYLLVNRNEVLSKLRAKGLIKFDEVVAHHVTWKFGVEDSLPPDVKSARIVGIASNSKIQALAVNINGSMDRPDGQTLHITLSLDRSKGAKPKDSNDLFAEGLGLLEPLSMEIQLEPKFFPF